MLISAHLVGRHCPVDVAASVQFSWPPASSYLAASVQNLMAAVTQRRLLGLVGLEVGTASA